MLMKLISETDADHIAVVFDIARKTFRNGIYAEYKANRPRPARGADPAVRAGARGGRRLQSAAIEQAGFEADDLIATYARVAREAGARVTIVSSDKDLMQLVKDGIEMLDPMKGKPIGPAEVAEKFGVRPAKVIDVQALGGDSVDNVPGVPGIGVKTAAELINEYGDLESLLKHAGEIKQPKRRESLQQFADQARISKQLVVLDDHVTLDVPLARTRRYASRTPTSSGPSSRSSPSARSWRGSRARPSSRRRQTGPRLRCRNRLPPPVLHPPVRRLCRSARPMS